jgi:prepilin-type N-terminal cleavage/methylation domain-containing protein
MSRRPADGGFTLVETIVALSIVGTIMASLAVFFVRSATVQHEQADTQVAVQLATSSMDYVSQLPGPNVVLGRTSSAVQSEWALASSQAPGVGAYLAKTAQASQDPSVPAPASVQGLPTTPETVQLTGDSTPYKRWWFVGTCWQPKTGGDCVLAAAAGSVQMYRVIVAITWPSPNCTAGLCQYVAAMLTESTLEDPTWQ